jgi:hypothetical protein
VKAVCSLGERASAEPGGKEQVRHVVQIDLVLTALRSRQNVLARALEPVGVDLDVPVDRYALLEGIFEARTIEGVLRVVHHPSGGHGRQDHSPNRAEDRGRNDAAGRRHELEVLERLDAPAPLNSRPLASRRSC